MREYLMALVMMIFGLAVMWTGNIGNSDRLYLTGMVWMVGACSTMILLGRNS